MFPLIFSTIRDADDRAFMEQFYDQYHKLMYSQIYKLTRDSYDVEEIVQESLLHLIEKVSLLKTLPRDRLINYTISTSRYTAFAYFKKQRRNETIPFEDIELSWRGQQNFAEPLEELVLRRIEGEKLYEVWTQLKERDQALLNMKYILDYTNDEIAEFFGVKPERIRMMLTRAKRNLAAGLASAMTND